MRYPLTTIMVVLFLSAVLVIEMVASYQGVGQ